MKYKKKVVTVSCKFDVEYEHAEHLYDMLKELEKRPIANMSGAGVASDDKVYGYRCKMRENGEVLNG